MELEIGRLDRRYESLRSRNARRERRVLASIEASGQQTPIVVVRDGDRDVVIDGYKRVRALHRLGSDVVRATAWDLVEVDALVLERVLRGGDHDNAVEQGWFLRELETRFGLGRDELARRFDRTPSWVSRRLALVRELPAQVQAYVGSGAIGAHAAMRHLIPLARANEQHCIRLSEAIAARGVSSRALAELCTLYAAGNLASRERLIADPTLVLRAREQARREGNANLAPFEHVLADLRIVIDVVGRASGRIRRGALDDATEMERERVETASAEAYSDVASFVALLARENGHAR